MKSLVPLYGFLMLQFFAQVIMAQHAPLDFNLVKGVSGITLGKITSITQDRLGYMWFADQGNGCITRFDGYKMKSYGHDPSDSNSLSNKALECIAADSSGCIWTTTKLGVDKLDPTTNKFIHYRYPPNEVRSIHAILIDHLGTVWLGTRAGLDRLDQKTGKFTHYAHKNNDPGSISCDTVRTLYEDHEGELWVGTGWEFDPRVKEGGLNRFNRETGTFTRYVHDPDDPHSLISNKVKAIFEDSRGVFWVGTDGDGLHIMDRKMGTFERLAHDPLHPEKLSRPPVKNGQSWADHITFITEDGAGAIWIGTYYAGLVRYDPRTKEITHFDSTDKLRPKGFTDNTSWCAYRSREGVLWIATESEENLFRIDPFQTGISTINMGDEFRRCYEDSSGTTWMSLRKNGLLRIDPGKAGKRYFKHDPADPLSISSNEVTFFQPGTGGFYWVGTRNGLNLYNSKTNCFTKYLFNARSKGDNVDTAVLAMLKGDDGELYVGTNKGFIIMNPQTRLMKHYVDDIEDTTSINSNIITDLYTDKSGYIWIGTFGGLNIFNIKTKKFSHFLSGNAIESIYKDKRGIIWVGTTNGLYYRNGSAGSFSAVDEWGKEFRTAGIQVNLEDDDKNIWGSSSMMIFRLNPQKHELCMYGEKYGINRNSHWRGSFKTSDGRLMFSKEDGYYSFLPSNVINSVPPQVILTDFKMNGQPVNPEKNLFFNGALEETKLIKLEYYQNTFSIDFAAIHYSSPEDNILYYMLEGYDNAWLKADSLKTVNYYKIPTGEYVFKIKASSSYGVGSVKEVKIIIHSPWWRTWWFSASGIILSFVPFYLLIRWWLNRKFRKQLERTAKEKQLAELNQKATELEMQALRSQMNPHFIFNSLNSINMFILENNKLQASEYLSKFSKLIRLILQNSQEAFVPLERELEALQLYLELESLRFEQRFEYKITVEDDVDTSMLKVPPLIIQPYAENAIWHGLMHKKEKGHLTIEIYIEKEILFYKITDDGIGRQKATELKSKSASTHKSMGMRITTDRLLMLQQQNETSITITDLVFSDKSPGGTEVVIKIPVRYD